MPKKVEIPQRLREEVGLSSFNGVLLGDKIDRLDNLLATLLEKGYFNITFDVDYNQYVAEMTLYGDRYETDKEEIDRIKSDKKVKEKKKVIEKEEEEEKRNYSFR